METLLLNDGETLDEVIGGALYVIQSVKGYRFSIDSYLLSYFVNSRTADHILDIGAGSGVISILIAYRYPLASVVGVEIQEEMVDMAKRSITLNNLNERVKIICEDIKNIEKIIEKQIFDIVVFNPPYRKLMSGRINIDRQKSVARHEIKGSLGDFLLGAAYALKKAGRMYLIYPASRLVELFHYMRSVKIEPKKIQVVHSYTTDKGVLVLVEGVKNGREEIEILPPFIIYDKNGNYTEDTINMFKALSEIQTGGV